MPLVLTTTIHVATAATPGPAEDVGYPIVANESLVIDHWSAVGDGQPGATARVSLPLDAQQGPVLWHTGVLNYRIDAPSSPDAPSFFFSATINGFAFAQIRATRTDSGYRWTTADLLNGSRQLATATGKVRGRFENYLQLNSVQPGDNEVGFSVRPTSIGDLSVAPRVEILPGSSIVRTNDSPEAYKASIVSVTWQSKQSLRVRLAVMANSGSAMDAPFGVSVTKVGGASLGEQNVREQVDGTRLVDVDVGADRSTTSRLAVQLRISPSHARSRLVTSNLIVRADESVGWSLLGGFKLAVLAGALVLMVVGVALLKRSNR